MPIIESSKKRLRQSIKRASRNRAFKAEYTKSRKAFEKAIKAQDLDLARSIISNKKEDWRTISSGLQSNIDKLVKKNILHKNNWDRKKSKFDKMLKDLESSLKS